MKLAIRLYTIKHLDMCASNLENNKDALKMVGKESEDIESIRQDMETLAKKLRKTISELDY